MVALDSWARFRMKTYCYQHGFAGGPLIAQHPISPGRRLRGRDRPPLRSCSSPRTPSRHFSQYFRPQCSTKENFFAPQVFSLSPPSFSSFGFFFPHHVCEEQQPHPEDVPLHPQFRSRRPVFRGGRAADGDGAIDVGDDELADRHAFQQRQDGGARQVDERGPGERAGVGAEDVEGAADGGCDDHCRFITVFFAAAGTTAVVVNGNSDSWGTRVGGDVVSTVQRWFFFFFSFFSFFFLEGGCHGCY